MPSLEAAQDLGRRAAKSGFDWPDHRGALEKLEEELEEVRECLEAPDTSRDHLREEIGDLLFSVVNLARKVDITADEALRRANRKFRSRFRRMEELAGMNDASTASFEDGPKLSLKELEALWTQAKNEE